jgi:hypothetical protein
MNDATPGIGHNNPPAFDPDLLVEHNNRTQELIDGANRAANEIGAIESAEQAGRISAFIDQLRAQQRTVEASRKAEKKVHDDAAKEVQEAYTPLLRRLEAALAVVQRILLPWNKRLEDEAKAEAARKAAEAEAARKAAADAERAARAPTGDVVGAAVAADEARAAADRADKEAARAAKAKVGVAPSVGGGRAKSVRRRKVPVITDRSLIPRRVLLLVDDEAILKALRANMDVAATCPGVEVRETEIVV